MTLPKDTEVPSEDRHHHDKHEKKEKRKSKVEKSSRPEKERERERERERGTGKEREKDREDKDGDGSKVHRHKSSRRSKLSSVDSDSYLSHSKRHRSHRERPSDEFSELPAASSVTDLIPEMSRLGSSRPYPSFSKAHSKEDVSRFEKSHDPLTPEPTDLASDDRRRSKSADHSTAGSRKVSSSSRRKEARPPTPPETDLSKQHDETASKSATGRSSKLEPLGEDARPRSSLSGMSRSTTKDAKSRVSTKSSKSKASSQATYIVSPRDKQPGISVVDGQSSIMTDDKTATSVGIRRKSSSQSSSTVRVKKKKRRPKPEEVPEEEHSPESAPDSSPKTPTVHQMPPAPPLMSHDKMPMHHNMPFGNSAVPIPPMPPPMSSQTPMTDFTDISKATPAPPPPPPPPPPPLNIQEAPRVDYLLANGGLPRAVPRNFLQALPRQNGTRPSNPSLTGCQTLFAPFFNLLEQYQGVLNKQGSIAVATGHRTVARRLLDRLENVFSRDLSPAGCSCILCDNDDLDHHGLGWGEVLERVSGRMDLPHWPPFDISTLGSGKADGIETVAADMPHRPSSPIKLDPDIAPEFREHYLRQTKKVRASVDKWLCKNEEHAPLPQDIDDDTLSFTILTSLDQEVRPYFNALLAGSKELQPALRAPTPMKKPRIEFIVKAGLSIQRLYRLAAVPRDAETALFLVNNPEVHDLIVTISDINPSEWEILTSGRFDGFLWSGVEDDIPTPTAENPGGRGGAGTPGGAWPGNLVRGMTPASAAGGRNSVSGMGSRMTTPFSRGPTPASFISNTSTSNMQSGTTTPNGGGPGGRPAVSNDEETELAVLAEVEREIYQGMEKLEDAFETLHHRAELVRTALRNRGAALSMSLQQRRHPGLGVAGDGMVPPHSGNSMYGMYERPSWAASTTTTEDEDGASPGHGGGEEMAWGQGGDNSEEFWATAGDGDGWGDLRPDDSASNISSNRHRKIKRRDERRTPAPIREDEEEA